MPFSGADLNGTPGGTDSLSKPTYPPDVRIAKGGSYVAFLVVNGPLTVRNRASIENIVRTLGTRGEYSMALLIRNDGGVIDVAATDLNFEDGITVTQVSPGVITIHIPTDGITDAMVAEDYATTDELSAAINAALTPYVTDSDLATALTNYPTDAELTTALNTKSSTAHRHTMNGVFSWTHTTNGSQSLITNPSLSHYVIADIPPGTLLHLSSTSFTNEGLPFRWAFVNGFGPGWFLYSAGYFTSV